MKMEYFNNMDVRKVNDNKNILESRKANILK